ncbi:MAG: hypothetical protein D6690_02325 [Nitrospirae bacterium]|nr:MAG: hypothetical protein D6690_02325 [Nitrospirota bacterium]
MAQPQKRPLVSRERSFIVDGEAPVALSLLISVGLILVRVLGNVCCLGFERFWKLWDSKHNKDAKNERVGHIQVRPAHFIHP